MLDSLLQEVAPGCGLLLILSETNLKPRLRLQRQRKLAAMADGGWNTVRRGRVKGGAGPGAGPNGGAGPGGVGAGAGRGPHHGGGGPRGPHHGGVLRPP